MKKQEKQKKKKESDILWNKKKGLRNYETNVISFLFMALFLAMAFYLVYFTVYKSDSVVNNYYNNDNSRTVNQTNNSPKSLSRLEIYRMTRNALG
mgnify:CR=1 FL=1